MENKNKAVVQQLYAST